MRAIRKRREPASLTAYRQTPDCSYDDYRQKDELRAALVHEQGGLCCYCMARIAAGEGSSKIEHWRCQSRYPKAQLIYRNLLAACRGGEGQPGDFQHCDTRKGNREIKWNPAEPDHRIEDRIHYERDGTISSTDPVFGAHLDKVLGLNLPHLKNAREGVLAGLLEWWKDERTRLHGPVPRTRLERRRNKLARNSSAASSPFWPVAIWWLDQKLNRAQN